MGQKSGEKERGGTKRDIRLREKEREIEIDREREREREREKAGKEGGKK